VAKQIPIDQVITDRKLRDDDDISELARAINDQGQKIPILLDHESNLIDGLRRMEALRSLGHTTILATQTSMYPVVCALLKQAREHGVGAIPLTPRRIWEIYAAGRPLQIITRSAYGAGKSRGQRLDKQVGGRRQLAQALGFNSVSKLQAITHVFRALNDPSPERAKRAERAVQLLEAGEISHYQAVDLINKPTGLSGPLRTLNEQRSALQASIATYRGLIKGLESLGPIHSKMPEEELHGYLGELLTLRAQMHKFTRLLQEETNRA
jgi:hypothetical protein